MKIQMLPNWSKKTGFLLFILCTIPSFYADFMNGLLGVSFKSEDYSFFKDIFGSTGLHILDIVSILGMLIYVFSSEKVEDDYINKLRLESYQITALVGLGGSVLLFSISKDLKLTLDYFIILFLWIYLFVFFIKKRLI